MYYIRVNIHNIHESKFTHITHRHIHMYTFIVSKANASAADVCGGLSASGWFGSLLASWRPGGFSASWRCGGTYALKLSGGLSTSGWHGALSASGRSRGCLLAVCLLRGGLGGCSLRVCPPWGWPRGLSDSVRSGVCPMLGPLGAYDVGRRGPRGC